MEDAGRGLTENSHEKSVRRRLHRDMPWMTMRTWYKHSDHRRSGRNDERRYDWEILFILQRNRRSEPMRYILRTSFAGSMRKWSVPEMNGVGNGTGV